MHQQ